jgi:hypothetical protein
LIFQVSTIIDNTQLFRYRKYFDQINIDPTLTHFAGKTIYSLKLIQKANTKKYLDEGYESVLKKK